MSDLQTSNSKYGKPHMKGFADRKGDQYTPFKSSIGLYFGLVREVWAFNTGGRIQNGADSQWKATCLQFTRRLKGSEAASCQRVSKRWLCVWWLLKEREGVPGQWGICDLFESTSLFTGDRAVIGTYVSFLTPGADSHGALSANDRPSHRRVAFFAPETHSHFLRAGRD